MVYGRAAPPSARILGIGDENKAHTADREEVCMWGKVRKDKGVTHGMRPSERGGVACMPFFTTSVIHGHRTLKAPHPVRSAQLTRVPPS